MSVFKNCKPKEAGRKVTILIHCTSANYDIRLHLGLRGGRVS